MDHTSSLSLSSPMGGRACGKISLFFSFFLGVIDFIKLSPWVIDMPPGKSGGAPNASGGLHTSDPPEGAGELGGCLID